MVLTITAPLWSDISDRSTRLLGKVYALKRRTNESVPITVTDMHAVNIFESPWWSYALPGRILEQDDFEGTLRWPTLSGTVTKASEPNYVHSGASAIKFVTGAVAGNGAGVSRHFPGSDSETQCMSIDMWWCLVAAAATTPREFGFTLTISDYYLANTTTMGVAFRANNAGAAVNRPIYLDSGGAWQLMGGAPYPIYITQPCWHFWQLQILRNAVSGYTYGNFWLDDHSYALGGVGGQVTAQSQKRITLALTVTTDVALATTAYVDDLIICTQTQEFI